MTDIVERLNQLDGFFPIPLIAKEAADEIEKLRGAIITNQSVALDALATHGQLCDEIERLREALRFYAEWGIDAPAVDAIIEKDRGDTARSALQQKESK